jgi:pilus assembly protein CpaD
MTSKILPLVAAAFALCGCATQTPGLSRNTATPLTPTEQYSFNVQRTPQDLALAIHPQGLSPQQQLALTDFVNRWTDNGGGQMVVKAPVNSQGDPAQGRHTADLTISFIEHLGVSAEHIRLAAYDAGHAPGAPVIASFERFEAKAPDCSGHWDSLTATKNNDASKHFGCAVTGNMAVLVANPRDLVIPANMDPSDNSRREVVLGKYRQGAITSTAQDDQASGKVSAASSQ